MGIVLWEMNWWEATIVLGLTKEGSGDMKKIVLHMEGLRRSVDKQKISELRMPIIPVPALAVIIKSRT